MALDAADTGVDGGRTENDPDGCEIAKLFEPTRDELVADPAHPHRDVQPAAVGPQRFRAGLPDRGELREPGDPAVLLYADAQASHRRTLLDLRMEPGDRIVYFEFQCTNEMGDLVRNVLCAELMGRYSNLVLVQNGRIIDALKRVDFEDSEIRQLLPGLPYTCRPNRPARIF